MSASVIPATKTWYLGTSTDGAFATNKISKRFDEAIVVSMNFARVLQLDDGIDTLVFTSDETGSDNTEEPGTPVVFDRRVYEVSADRKSVMFSVLGGVADDINDNPRRQIVVRVRTLKGETLSRKGYLYIES